MIQKWLNTCISIASSLIELNERRCLHLGSDMRALIHVDLIRIAAESCFETKSIRIYARIDIFNSFQISSQLKRHFR